MTALAINMDNTFLNRYAEKAAATTLATALGPEDPAAPIIVKQKVLSERVNSEVGFDVVEVWGAADILTKCDQGSRPQVAIAVAKQMGKHSAPVKTARNLLHQQTRPSRTQRSDGRLYFSFYAASWRSR